MIRILLIGRSCQSLAEQMRLLDSLEVEYEALPAAAVRNMEASPPDLICLVERSVTAKTDLLVQGIQARPLGQLTPIMVVSESPGSEFQSLVERVDLWLEGSTPAQEIVRRGFELLGVEAPGTLTAPQVEDDDVPYYIEEIVEVAPRPVPSKMETEVSPDLIRRKIRAVRHDDYFVVLEVGRGAETPMIREAFYRLSRMFDVRSAPFQIVSEFEPEILEIADAIEDAWAVLGDSDLRRTYLDRTSRR